MHGIANTGLRDRPTEELATRIAALVLSKLRSCDTQNVCNVLWGLATYGSDEETPQAAALLQRQEVIDLFRAVDEQRAAALLKEADESAIGQDISNLVWSFAKAGLPFPGVLAAMRDAFVSRPRTLKAFNGQHLTNTAWGIATLGGGRGDADTHTHTHHVLTAIAAEACDKPPRSVESFHLATMAWAFAKSEHAVPWLFERIVREFEPRKVDARGLSQLVWAVSTSGFASKCPELFATLAQVLPPRLHELSEQNLSMVAWGYANAEHWSEAALFEHLGREMESRLPRLTDKQLATIAWALGKFRPSPPPGAFRGLAAMGRAIADANGGGGGAAGSGGDDRRNGLRSAAPLDRWDPGHLAMSLYGFAMAELKQGPLFAAYRNAIDPMVHRA